MNISRISIPLALLSALPAQWSQATPASNPGGRASFGFASDLLGNALMFGGVASVSPLNQTWLWNGTDWAQLTPTTSPTARQQMEVVFDSVRNRYVVYGGWTSAFSTGNANGHTWEYDPVGNTWAQMTPTTTAGNRCRYGAAFDSVRGRVVMYGGAVNGLPGGVAATWEYDGTTWAQVPGANTPGALTEPAMCFNIALNRTVMFGGVEQLASTSVDTTWLFDGTSWVAAPITGPKPPVRTFGKMVYNLQRGTCVLVGGMNPFTGVALNDAWEFNGSTWTQLPGTAPAVRAFGLAYDIVRANVVHFGGLNASSQVSNQTSLFGAQATTYGAGCVGSNGVPTLLPVDQPRIGANWQLVMNNNNAVSPIAIIVVGASSTAPIPLDAIGMLGCAGFVTPDLLLTTGSSAGVAPWSTTIPNDPAVVSAHLYIQGISFDPGINPAWLVSSNAVDGLVGY